MTFDEAFERLIGHEGGYVNHPASRLQYVDEPRPQSHLRISASNACGIGGRSADTHAAGRSDLRPANKLARVRVPRAGLHETRVCQGPVQRALHPRPKGPAFGGSRAGEKAGWCVRRVRRSHRPQGRMGLVPASLSASSLRDAKGCCGGSVWRQVRALPRLFSPSGLRLSSPRRQGWITQRDVPEQVTQRACLGVVKVHSPVRQLPPAGAQQ